MDTQDVFLESDVKALKGEVIAAVREIFDPEIPVNIYELGLIYDVAVDEAQAVHLAMTLTSPNCPAAASLPGEVEQKVKAIPGVTDCAVEIVWDPPWDPSKMSEAARLKLNMF